MQCSAKGKIHGPTEYKKCPIKMQTGGTSSPSKFTCYPFPKRQILDSSKLKNLADDNFNVDESDRKFSKRVENTVGEGEIACYKQFLLFQQSFQKTCTADT